MVFSTDAGVILETLPNAGVAEMADARDSKSRALHWACGFDPHLQHHFLDPVPAKTVTQEQVRRKRCLQSMMARCRPCVLAVALLLSTPFSAAGTPDPCAAGSSTSN